LPTGGNAIAVLAIGSHTVSPDAPAGSSLARQFADLDSDDNFSDFGVLSVPTPGQADFTAVPEPGTATMMLVGLACLAVLNRRLSGMR
jgi:hypothetical protein